MNLNAFRKAAIYNLPKYKPSKEWMAMVGKVQSQLFEWFAERNRKREQAILKALRLYLPEWAITAMIRSRKKNLMNLFSLRIEHQVSSGYEIDRLRIYRHGKMVHEADLNEALQTERSEVPSPEGEGS